jgi:hypothetical protein
MQEKPKEEGSEPAESSCGEKDQDVWEADQKEREYYYDDAHGYEVFEDEAEDDDDTDDRS